MDMYNPLTEFNPQVGPAVGVSQAPQFSWQSRLGAGVQNFLGDRDLALALLTNSGPSTQRRSFGQILGSSMMQADQAKQMRVQQGLENAFAMARLQAAQEKQGASPFGTIPVEKYTLPSLAKFQQTHNYADLVEKNTNSSIGKISPQDYTPESLAKYAQTGQMGDLVRYIAPARMGGKIPGVSGFDDPRVQALQASMVAAGYSPPAGFRSKEQQLSMFQGLLKKYDGLSTDDIAHLAASNAIDYKSIGKATQAAASMGGRVEVANNELRAFVPIAKDASAAVDRGSFVPFNKLKQRGQAAISDPDLKRLYVATQTVLNAYDVLAARGGTDQKKREENHKILENADSPEAYNAALDMIIREGQAAGSATRDAMKSSAFGYPTGQPDVAPAPKVINWNDLK